MRQAIFFLLMSLTFIWSGCNSTKSVPANDKLYTGAGLSLNGVSNTRERKALQEDLHNLLRPKPNSKFLGLRLKLGIYNMFHKAKPKSFWGKIRDKYGEPPVLLSQVDLQKKHRTCKTICLTKDISGQRSQVIRWSGKKLQRPNTKRQPVSNTRSIV